jgi:hypothetical protein
VRVPVLGFQRNGLVGFSTGIMKGTAGLLSKPVVGILDAITHTGDNVSAVVKVVSHQADEPVRRKRLSNLFGPDGRILPYGFAVALGSHAIQAIDQELDGYFIKQQAKMLKRSKNAGLLHRLGLKEAHSEGEREIDINPSSSRPLSGRITRSGSLNYAGMSAVASQRESVKDRSILRTGSMDIGMHRTASIYYPTPRSSSNLEMHETGGKKKRFSKFFKLRKRKDRRQTITEESEAGLEDIASERMDSESVIFTAIIRTGKKDVDELIIITTHRIASVYYRRDTGGSKLTKHWMVRFSELQGVEYSLGNAIVQNGQNRSAPLHRSQSVLGSGATLTLVLPGPDRSKDKVISVDNYLEDTLIAVHKCICVLTGKHGDINKDDCEGMKYDPYTKIFHIGPWEYEDLKAKRDDSRNLVNNTRTAEGEKDDIMLDLENQPWDPSGCTGGLIARENEPLQVKLSARLNVLLMLGCLAFMVNRRKTGRC